MTNTPEVQRALEREYPNSLRDAGIGGTVQVWFFIDTVGVVVNQKVQESSGYEALDQAALEVARIARFTPAQNMDQKVPEWTAIPVRFQVRR